MARALPYAAVVFAAGSWGTWGLAIRWTQAIRAMPSAPAVTGTKARIGGTKRAKNTAQVPQRRKNASLCAITAGYLLKGQALRISCWER